MRICTIGKFPPIQGGVSMRTFQAAHALAARGHEIHVITNAKEAAPPFRMHMRTEDWAQCEGRFGAGSVTVHWTDPVDRSQSHIPMTSPFVTKLAAIAGRVHSARPFDVIFSHYMEPYGIAGYLAAQITGAPHVVRMAGSDAGRLWHHPQFEALYDHVLRSAEFVVASGVVADRAAEHGVDPRRIAPGGSYALPHDLFAPQGPTLDLGSIRKEVGEISEVRDQLWGGFMGGRPHFGIYGKLGDNKGSFALLDAMHKLKLDGLDVGLLALAHGRPDVEARFREKTRKLGLFDRVMQIPFLPHWRVPEFLRGCLAVCCLEQNFPIRFHSPIIPLEVLLCGSCLVASTEVIRKLPQWDSLPHGYGCVAINNVNDMIEMRDKLAAILRKPKLVPTVGARGRAFALQCEQGKDFPATLERILEAAAERRMLSKAAPPPAMSSAEEAEKVRFSLTDFARTALQNIGDGNQILMKNANFLEDAQHVLAVIKKAIALGNTNLLPFAQGVEVEIAIAEAETKGQRSDGATLDPLFRIDITEWALENGALGNLIPVRNCQLRVLRFEYDISDLLCVQTMADYPKHIGLGPSYLIVFEDTASRGPLIIDRFSSRILELSDGTRTCDEIGVQLEHELGDKPVEHLEWMENLLLSGLIGLHDLKTASVSC